MVSCSYSGDVWSIDVHFGGSAFALVTDLHHLPGSQEVASRLSSGAGPVSRCLITHQESHGGQNCLYLSERRHCMCAVDNTLAYQCMSSHMFQSLSLLPPFSYRELQSFSTFWIIPPQSCTSWSLIFLHTRSVYIALDLLSYLCNSWHLDFCLGFLNMQQASKLSQVLPFSQFISPPLGTVG